jgi:amino-acid N-acetyltransferase
MVEIKEARKKDFEEIKAIIQRGAREGKILKRNKREIHKLIKERNLIVAKEGERIIGIVALEYYSKRFSELRTLYILHEYRSKGAGALLVNAVLKKAEKKKIKEIITITTKETSKWFKKHGFCEAAHKLKVALFREI